jgi:hypothetical protein
MSRLARLATSAGGGEASKLLATKVDILASA